MKQRRHQLLVVLIVKKEKQDYNPLQRIYNGPWTYTHLAVGRNVFATIVDMGLGSWIGYFASLFRISRAAADFVFGYMGARGISAGGWQKFLIVMETVG